MSNYHYLKINILTHTTPGTVSVTVSDGYVSRTVESVVGIRSFLGFKEANERIFQADPLVRFNPSADLTQGNGAVDYAREKLATAYDEKALVVATLDISKAEYERVVKLVDNAVSAPKLDTNKYGRDPVEFVQSVYEEAGFSGKFGTLFSQDHLEGSEVGEYIREHARLKYTHGQAELFTFGEWLGMASFSVRGLGRVATGLDAIDDVLGFSEKFGGPTGPVGPILPGGAFTNDYREESLFKIDLIDTLIDITEDKFEKFDRAISKIFESLNEVTGAVFGSDPDTDPELKKFVQWVNGEIEVASIPNSDVPLDVGYSHLKLAVNDNSGFGVGGLVFDEGTGDAKVPFLYYRGDNDQSFILSLYDRIITPEAGLVLANQLGLNDFQSGSGGGEKYSSFEKTYQSVRWDADRQKIIVDQGDLQYDGAPDGPASYGQSIEIDPKDSSFSIKRRIASGGLVTETVADWSPESGETRSNTNAYLANAEDGAGSGVVRDFGVVDWISDKLAHGEVDGVDNSDFPGNFDDPTTYNNSSSSNVGVSPTTAGSIGSFIGGQLASLFESDSAALGYAADIFASTTFGQIGRSLADTGNDLAGKYEVSGSSIAQGTLEAGVGLVGNLAGSALGSELAEALGINEQYGSLVGGVFGRATANVVASQVSANLGIEAFGAHQQLYLDGVPFRWETPTLGQALSAALPAAIGSYAGSYLANKIFDLDPKGAQIGGAVGSLAGGIIANQAGLLAAGALNPGTMIAVAAIFFASSFFGTSIGGLLGGKEDNGPAGHSNVMFGDEHFFVPSWGVDNGAERSIVIDMGQAASDILNGVTARIGGRIANIYDFGEGSAAVFGYDRLGHFGGIIGNYGGSNLSMPHYGSSGYAIEQGVLEVLRELKFEGGDVYMKRALARTTATTLTELDQDLTAALDWSFYRTDEATFLAMVANGGQEAADRWADSQARAAALNLDGGDTYDYSRADHIAAWEAEQAAIEAAAYDPSTWVYEDQGSPDGPISVLVGYQYDGTLYYFPESPVIWAQKHGPKTVPVEEALGYPIVLDLDGDGLELVSINDSSAFFELEDTGFRHRVGWVQPDDGFLVYDKDSDGLIVDHDELAFRGYVDGAKTDLEGLNFFDSNQDGVLDASDTDFAKFGIWRDLDQDGETDVGEFTSLAAAGIASLELTSDGNETLHAGNRVLGLGAFTRTDSSTGVFGDVALAYGPTGYRHNADGSVTVRHEDGETMWSAGDGTGATSLDLAGAGLTSAYGGVGNDTLTGGDADEKLSGGGGSDTLSGGGGDDVLVIDAADLQANIDGGAGSDMAVVEGDGAVTLDLGASNIEAAVGGGGNDVFSTSGSGAVALAGGAGNDSLTGGTGDDRLDGGSGDDALVGGAGHDILIGGTGNDTLDAGAGDDVLLIDSADALTGIDAGDGFDMVIADGSLGIAVDLGQVNAEMAIGGLGSDVFWTTGTGAVDLSGQGGDDALFGGAGDDRLDGGSGDDALLGGVGADLLSGGIGRDTAAYGGSDAAVTINLATGRGQGGDAEGDVLQGIENIAASSHADVLLGSRDSNLLQGGGGADLLDGGAGDDALEGGLGDDTYVYARGDGADDVLDDHWYEEVSQVQQTVYTVETVPYSYQVLEPYTYTVQEIVTYETVESVEVSSEVPLGSRYNADGSQSWVYFKPPYPGYVPPAEGGAEYIETPYNGLVHYVHHFGDEQNPDGYMEPWGTVTETIHQTVVKQETRDVERTGYHYVTYEGTRQVQVEDTQTVPQSEWKQSDGGVDRVVFGAGIGLADLVFDWSHNAEDQDDPDDLVLGLRQSGSQDVDVASLADRLAFIDWANVKNRVETLEFADGTSLDISGDPQFGDDADNTLTGGAGTDILVGGDGADTLNGGDGVDLLSGGEGSDTLGGGLGDDVLHGDGGADDLDGGAGDDILIGGEGADHLDGGTGIDAASYAFSEDGVRVRLDIPAATGGDAAGDTLTAIESLTGSARADLLVGDSGANVIEGGLGNDTLAGGAGDDTLIGGAGYDAATFAGDVAGYTVSRHGDTITVTDGNAADGDDGTDTLTGVEELRFADQTVTVSDLPDVEEGVISVPSGTVVTGRFVAGAGAAGGSLTYSLEGTADVDGWVTLASGSRVRVTDASTGAYEYEAAAGFVGNESFDVKVSEAGGFSDVAAMSVSVGLADGVDALAAGSSLQVNSYTTGDQDGVSLAALSDGFIATWRSDSQDGGGYGVYGQRYDASGNALGSEFRVNSTTVNHQYHQSVTELSDGSFVIAWTSTNQDGSGHGVYGQRYASDGTAVGGEFLINTHTSLDQEQPSIAALSAGGFAVIWSSYNQDGGNFGVYGQRYDAAGVKVGSEFLVNSTTADVQTHPVVASLSGGGFVVSWSSNGQDGDKYGVYGQRYASDGTAVGGEFQVNTHTDGDQDQPSIAALADGGFIVVWESGSAQDGSGEGVFGQRYDAAGARVGAEFQINTTTLNDQGEPSVAALSDGGFVVTWQSGQGGAYDIHGQRYDANGEAVGNEYVIAGTGSDEQQPAIAALADGGYVVGWQTANGDGSGWSVNAQRYDAATPIVDATGTAGSDVLVGNHLSNDLRGGFGADDLSGAGSDDTLDGGSGDDVLTGGTGDDTLSGGSGTDAAVFGGNFADYSVRRTGGVVAVTDGNAADGDDGTDTLTGVEQLRFADQTVTVSDLPDVEEGVISVPSGTVVTGRFVAGAGAAGGSLTYSLEGTADVDGWVTLASGSRVRVTDASTGAYEYEAAAGFVGNESFDVRVSEGGTQSTTEFQVNSTTTGDQRHSSMAALTGGGFVVVWESFGQDGDGYGIYGQRLDANGAPVGSEFLVNTTTAHDQERAFVQAMSDGGFLVVWQSVDASLGEGKILSQRYAADGSTVGSEVQINTYDTGYQLNPKVAVLDGGTYVVVWQSQNQDGDGYGIYGQHYWSDGSPKGSEFQVNTTTVGDQADPVVTTHFYGGWYVMWRSEGQDGDQGAYVRRYFEWNGSAFSEEVVNTTTAGDQGEPVAAYFPDGRSLLSVWRSDGQDGSSGGIYGNLYDVDDGYSITGEFQINTTTLGNQSPASFGQNLVLLSDGGFVVMWSSQDQDGDGYGIYGQRFDATANQIGSEFRINDHTAGDQRYPSAVLDASGRLIVTWTSTGQDGDGAGIIGRIINSDGSAVGGGGAPASSGFSDTATMSVEVRAAEPASMTSEAEFQLNSYSTLSQEHVVTAMLLGGGFVAVWSSNGQDGDNFGVFGRLFDSDGTALGSEFQINEYTSGHQVASGLSVLPGGGFLVTWRSDNQDGSLRGVYGRRYDASGVASASEFRVNTTTNDDQINVKTAVLADGSLVAVWLSNAQDGDGWGVFGQRYDSSGAALGGEFQINTHTVSSQAGAKVALLQTGGFVVVWSSLGQDGDGYGIFAQLFDASGTTVGTEFQVNQVTAGHQEESSIATLADGRFVVTWQSQGQDGSGHGVYARIFDAGGTASGNEFLVNTTTSGNQFAASVGSAVAALPDGGFAIAWWSDAQDGSGYGIYGQRYDATATAVGSEFLINGYTVGDQDHPSISSSADGRILVSWTSRTQDGGTEGVYAKEYTLALTPEVLVGGASNDTLAGGYLDDTLSGGMGADSLAGFIGDDSLDGGLGDDVLSGGTGDDVLDGGAGTDTAVFDGDYADYLLVKADGQITVTDNKLADGNDGTDTLIGVEELQFADRKVAVADIPDGEDASVTIVSGTHASGHLAANAPAAASLSFELLDGPSHGAAVVNADGTYSYTPDHRYLGNDSFRYRVTWNDGSVTYSDVATVAVEVATDALPVTAGNEYQVNVTTAGDQASSDIVVLSNGSFAMAWQDSAQDGSGLGVYGRLLDAGGNPTGAEFRINQVTTNDQAGPALVALADGGFMATWYSRFQDGDGYGVYGRLYNADGSVRGNEFQLSTTTASDQLYPRSAEMTNGDIVVVWVSAGQDGDADGVYGRRFDATGQALSGEFLVNTTTLGTQTSPRITATADGGFAVTWYSINDGVSSGRDVYARRFDAAGSALDPAEFRVNTNTFDYQDGQDITVLLDGSFVVTWASAHQSAQSSTIREDIFAQHYNADGTARGSEFIVNSKTENHQYHPNVAALDDGGFVILWYGYSIDSNGFAVAGQRFDANGAAIGDEFQVNQFETGHQAGVTVAPVTGGGFVVTWTSQAQDGDGSGIFARVYSGSMPSQVFAGTTGNDVLAGGIGDDSLDGGTGSDTLTGGAGNDTLVGGEGSDTAVFGGVFADYDLIRESGKVLIADLNTADGDDGTDALTGIEELRFADQSVSLADLPVLSDILISLPAGTLTSGQFAATDDDGASGLTYSLDGTPDGAGWITLASGSRVRLTDAATGAYEFDAAVGFVGLENFVARATDAGGAVEFANVSVDVRNAIPAGPEVLAGGYGDDLLVGGSNNDLLAGGVGSDRLSGGSGDDAIDGGSGDDILVGGAGADLLDGGSGTDVASYAASASSVSINLASAMASGGDAAGDILYDIENVIGSALDDHLVGSGVANRLEGGGGADTLDGREGNDELYGGAGGDALTGGAGDDTLEGGNGSDTLTGGDGFDIAAYSLSASAVTVNLLTNVATGGDAQGDTFDGIEGLTGSAFSDALTGDAGDNLLAGAAGNDALTGGDGSDLYQFGRNDGTDTIHENAADDGSDMILFGDDIAKDQIWFVQNGLNLEVSIIGGSDKLIVENWYDTGGETIEEFATSEGDVLSFANVQNLVNAMAAFTPPAPGETTLPPSYQDDLQPVLAANWQ